MRVLKEEEGSRSVRNGGRDVIQACSVNDVMSDSCTCTKRGMYAVCSEVRIMPMMMMMHDHVYVM